MLDRIAAGIKCGTGLNKFLPSVGVTIDKTRIATSSKISSKCCYNLWKSDTIRLLQDQCVLSFY